MSSNEASNGGRKTPVVTVEGSYGRFHPEIQVIRDLWASVLALGISDYILSASAMEVWNRQTKTEPILWFESKSKEYGSFEWCCELLGWDPGLVRTQVLEQKSRKVQLRQAVLSVVD